MADNQLFPVFDLPEIPDVPEYDEIYRPSAYFDYETGDFLRDGANRIVASDGREAYMQWCVKAVSTERESCLAYSDDIGTEFEELADISDTESRESYIELTITEALIVHPATEYVKDFEFTHDGDGTWVSFVVKGYPWEEEERLSIRVGGENDGI